MSWSGSNPEKSELMQPVSTGPRFGQSQSGSRLEDLALITGAGRFTDDISLPGQAHAVFVRANVGHAEISLTTRPS
jgi:CO/xanthine dehydrogenase Mo-binding subunit